VAKTAIKMITGYNCVVRGTFHAASGKDRVLKTFGPATFFLPEYVEIPNGKKKSEVIVNGAKRIVIQSLTKKSSVAADNVALYIVQRRLLPTWLAENHPDAIGFRTCSITPGGMKRVQRPESELVNLDRPVDQMSLQELTAFCKMKNLNVPVSAFKDVHEARVAVLAEMDPASAPPLVSTEPQAPEGVDAKYGAVSSSDGIPTDEEDPASDLLA